MKTESSYCNVRMVYCITNVHRALVRLSIAKMKKTVIYFMVIIIIMCHISLYVVE